MKNERLMIILGFVPLLLMIPLIGMQFSAEVNWSAFDFLLMAILLSSLGLMIEFVLRKVTKKNRRIALIALVFFVFFLIYAELAVGIFGSPFAGS